MLVEELTKDLTFKQVEAMDKEQILALAGIDLKTERNPVNVEVIQATLLNTLKSQEETDLKTKAKDAAITAIKELLPDAEVFIEIF